MLALLHCVLKCQKRVLLASVTFPRFPERRHVYRPVGQVRPGQSATARPAEEGSAFDGRPMEECLRSACPCLEALCDRVFGRKQDGVPQYTAVWGFESRLPNELSFHQGDLFAVPNRDGDWWAVQRVDTDGAILESGIAPANYLARTGTLESQR